MPLSQTSLKHFSISNIYLSQTSLYLEHLSTSNISLSWTSLYLEYLSTSNIYLPRKSLFQTSLYLKHLSISNIPLSQTSLYLKHLSISKSLYLKHLSTFLICSLHLRTARIKLMNILLKESFLYKKQIYIKTRKFGWFLLEKLQSKKYIIDVWLNIIDVVLKKKQLEK